MIECIKRNENLDKLPGDTSQLELALKLENFTDCIKY